MSMVLVWNEYRHELHDEKIKAIYPDGIHGAIAGALSGRGHEVKTAWLDQPDHGLTQEALDNTEVLIWWGHMAHEEVSDEAAERVARRVYGGMGLVVLHSGHASKPFNRLMGTPTGNLRWREADEKERLWVVAPGHPIAEGLGGYFEIPNEETYGEQFGIPEPDELVFISWFAGGEVFRSGCCFRRGAGSIFYFRPGHESYPVYHQEEVHKVLDNAVRWATPHTPVAYPNDGWQPALL